MYTRTCLKIIPAICTATKLTTAPLRHRFSAAQLTRMSSTIYFKMNVNEVAARYIISQVDGSICERRGREVGYR